MTPPPQHSWQRAGERIGSGQILAWVGGIGSGQILAGVGGIGSGQILAGVGGIGSGQILAGVGGIGSGQILAGVGGIGSDQNWAGFWVIRTDQVWAGFGVIGSDQTLPLFEGTRLGYGGRGYGKLICIQVYVEAEKEETGFGSFQRVRYGNNSQLLRISTLDFCK